MAKSKTSVDAAVEVTTSADATVAATVPMVRSSDYPAPHNADVHPDEVDNYRVAGWVEA